jgi:CRISPR-associated protein Csm1
MTAAIASCISLYTKEKDSRDYETDLYRNADRFCAENTFLMYSMDVSGIQDFIYTITSEHALRTLRARSFYLEIMMEHIIDSLLEKLHLSRANLIYSGGGHCYLLLPNTESTKNILRENTEALNQWLLDTFQISLYVADGYAQCSANALQNQPDGSYSQIFRDISTMISAKKSHRYAPADLVKMNTMQEPDYARECKVCKRIAKVGEDGECRICKAIEKFSTKILYSEYYTVLSQKKEGALPLPGDACLVADDSSTIEARVQEETCVRTYRKNGLHDTKTATTKLWVGDYTTGKPAQDMAQEAEGIDRIAILRADVDNLGHAFVAGFENPKNNNRYVTLSRTATLSRQLSLFFKCHINQILREPEYTISGQPSRGRNVTICYSGGDDLFIVGAWNEVIEAAVGIRRKFQQYTQGMLTLSAGIGIYQPGYPISASAREVADLEDASKHLPGKNAVTLFPDGERHSLQDEVGMTVSVNDGTYNWNTFEQKVVGEKYHSLDKFFTASDDRGNSFLYHLLALIRNRKEKIYFARYVYLLSRLEPDKEAPPEQIENYKEFSEKMYRWYLEETDCRELKTAMNLYAYLKRKREDEEA